MTLRALTKLHRLVSSVKVSSDKASVTVLKKRRSKNFCRAWGKKEAPIADGGAQSDPQRQTAASSNPHWGWKKNHRNPTDWTATSPDNSHHWNKNADLASFNQQKKVFMESSIVSWMQHIYVYIYICVCIYIYIYTKKHHKATSNRFNQQE